MKLKFLLCLSLILSVGLLGCSTLKNGYAWGKVADGFQMTAILDKSNGLVHCQIRNATTNEMDYPSFDFGYVEFVHLQVQELTNWVNLPAVKLPLQGYSGGDPYFTKKFKPRQIAKGSDLGSSREWPVLPFAEYLKISKGNTNEALLVERLNKWMAYRQALCANDTFAFDLVEMNWPTNIFQYTPIKMRAAQYFRTRHFGDTDQIIYSQEFTLDVSTIRSYLNAKKKMDGK
jgi:hypothetical protein